MMRMIKPRPQGLHCGKVVSFTAQLSCESRRLLRSEIEHRALHDRGVGSQQRAPTPTTGRTCGGAAQLWLIRTPLGMHS